MIDTLLDNDFYQFAMSHMVWQHGDGDLNVRYEFRNRTFAVPLASRLDLNHLRSEIERIRDLTFRLSDIGYLRSLGYFNEDWLDALLSDFELPPVNVSSLNGHLVMTYEGPWWNAIFWETILLSLVNEMYFARFGTFYQEGSLRLREKIEYLRERGTLNIVEFGTRRRFSRAWQHFVIHELLSEIPGVVLGTSNAFFAREFGIPAVGTMAHQLFMVYAAGEAAAVGSPVITMSTKRVLQNWSKTYGKWPEMMTALPDTYTTQKFIEVASPDDIRPFAASRQDSGDPIVIGGLLSNYARRLRDGRPRITFSDSLDVRRMSVLDDMFGADNDLAFGWGTDLTNDLGYEPLSIVIKPSAVQLFGIWYPCVKISDDIQKATGEAKAIQRYLQEIG